eukprot:COSAG02_NODE_103_length_36570_cov_25.164487_13_plen_89_part_00
MQMSGLRRLVSSRSHSDSEGNSHSAAHARLSSRGDYSEVLSAERGDDTLSPSRSSTGDASYDRSVLGSRSPATPAHTNPAKVSTLGSV